MPELRDNRKTLMANLDRSRVIELLGQLGATDDQTVLEAARAANRAVTEAGLTWDDVVRAEPASGSVDIDGDAQPAVEAVIDGTPTEAGGSVSEADKAESMRLIGRLLAGKAISDNLREDLTDMKRAIAEGEFDAMDARYVRALARRLGA
jgi:hypothetical protein